MVINKGKLIKVGDIFSGSLFAPVLSWSQKAIVVLAFDGGIASLIYEYLNKHGDYNKFYDVVQRQFTEKFDNSTQNENTGDFYLPLAIMTNSNEPFLACFDNFTLPPVRPLIRYCENITFPLFQPSIVPASTTPTTTTTTTLTKPRQKRAFFLNCFLHAMRAGFPLILVRSSHIYYSHLFRKFHCLQTYTLGRRVSRATT